MELINIQTALDKVKYNLSIIKLLQAHLKLSTVTRGDVAYLHLKAQSYLSNMLKLTVNHDGLELARLWRLYLSVSDNIKNIIV